MDETPIELRKVTWTETFTAQIGCGHHNCDVCEAVTPRPTDEQVIAFVKANPGDNFMWPCNEDWVPDGWEDSGGQLLCPQCVSAKNEALGKRRVKR